MFYPVRISIHGCLTGVQTSPVFFCRTKERPPIILLPRGRYWSPIFDIRGGNRGTRKKGKSNAGSIRLLWRLRLEATWAVCTVVNIHTVKKTIKQHEESMFPLESMNGKRKTIFAANEPKSTSASPTEFPMAIVIVVVGANKSRPRPRRGRNTYVEEKRKSERRKGKNMVMPPAWDPEKLFCLFYVSMANADVFSWRKENCTWKYQTVTKTLSTIFGPANIFFIFLSSTQEK